MVSLNILSGICRTNLKAEMNFRTPNGVDQREVFFRRFSASHRELERLRVNHELNATVVGTICWTLVVSDGIVVAVG